MNGFSSKMMGFTAFATMLAVMCATQASISAEIQWGFDYDAGTVASLSGGIVVNDGTGGALLGGEALHATAA